MSPISPFALVSGGMLFSLLEFARDYKPKLDCTGEFKTDGLQWYQELIGLLRWACELGRVDILYEVAIMSKYLAMS